MWQERQEKGESFPTTLAEALLLADKMLFPNLYQLMKILATIPVTSYECKRSISALGVVKTDLRSTMGQDRLNGLTMMHVHNHREVDINAIVDLFAVLHPRRMVLRNVLDDGEDT